VRPTGRVGSRTPSSGRRRNPLHDDQIDNDLEVGERGAKVVGDLLLSRRPRQRFGRAQVVADVIFGEDLMCEIGVSQVPHLLVEAAHESLVLLG
jgi:hypothetical protein